MHELFFKLLEEIDPNKLNMVYSSANGMTVLRSSEYDFRLEQIHELKRENIKLQEIIDKAIEIIESYNLGKYDYSVPPGGITDLLDLLRGKDE